MQTNKPEVKDLDSKRVRIPQPVKNGVAKVPVVMQLEALECGAASLAMIMAYYKRWIPLEQVRADCGVSRDGASGKKYLRQPAAMGWKQKAFVMSLRGFAGMVPSPASYTGILIIS